MTTSGDRDPAAARQGPGVFGRLALTVMRRPRLSGLLITALTTVGLLMGLRLTVNPNILELLPPDDPTTQAIQQINREEGGVNLLSISVKGEEPEAVDAFMRQLSARLEAMPEVEYALYDIPPELAWRLGLLQLTVPELSLIRDRLRGAVAIGPAVSNPFLASRLLDLGPLTEKLNSGGTSTAAFSPDQGLGRVLVRPTGSPYDPAFARPFMAEITRTLDALDPAARGLRVAWIGGAYRHAVEDVEGIIYDLRWTAVASFVMVLTLVGGAFRDLRAVLLIFGPLIVGTLWTLGFMSVVVGTLNTFTSFFAAVLVGLGVDFSIHLYSRYREERAGGGELRDAVARAWDAAGPPCATAAITSAVGFCALWTAGFQGFQQLGTILSGGVLLCLTAVLTTLPLLILWRESQPRAVPLRRISPAPRGAPPTYRLAPLGLMGAILAAIAALFLLRNVSFQYDMSELRREGLSYAELADEERELARDSYAPVVVSYPDQATLAADHERLSAALEHGEIPVISRLLSLYSILPADQEERLTVLEEIAELSRDENMRYLPAQVQQNLARISETPLAAITAEDLPGSLRHVLGANAGKHRMMIIPDGNMWDFRENVKLFDALKEWVPDRPAAGEFLATAVLYRLVHGDAPRVAIIALVGVFFISTLDLRSPLRALGAVSALVVGLAWAGAGMALFRIKLSIVNFVGIPILMGIGVDVVIHLLHRLREEGPGRVRWALSTTGWAAGLSASTTVLSFASLTFASSQGVQSLGQMIVLGLTLVTVAAFAVVPLGWMTHWKIAGELPTGESEPPG